MADGCTSMQTVTKDLDAKAVAERKDELVRVDTDLLAKIAEKVAVNREFNEEIKPLQKRQKELLAAIDNKRETIEIECVEKWDYANKLIRYVDPKTGKEINSAPMGPAELQTDLTDVAGGKNQGAKK